MSSFHFGIIIELIFLPIDRFFVLFEQKTTHRYAALKTLKNLGENDQYKRDFHSEIQLLSSMRHSCIVHFIEVSTRNDDNEPAYAFEFHKNGSLQDVLHTYPNDTLDSYLTPTQKTIIILGVAIGLDYLHFGATDKGSIIHRDIKSGNILPDGALFPKLADFGFSKVILNSGYHTQFRGSWPWMAPEVMAGEKYGPPADIFSFSMVMYELCTGHRPFPEFNIAEDFVQAVYNEKKRPQIQAASGPLGDLIQRCWDNSPSNRPAAAQIVQSITSGEACFLRTDMSLVNQYIGSLHLEHVLQSIIQIK
jgi:serine/threonine protein kinase